MLLSLMSVVPRLEQALGHLEDLLKRRLLVPTLPLSSDSVGMAWG